MKRPADYYCDKPLSGHTQKTTGSCCLDSFRIR